MEEHRDYVQGTHTGVGVNVARVPRRESRESKQQSCVSTGSVALGLFFVREIVACIFATAS